MPIYEYKCASCGHFLEALQKISDEPLKDCPECGEPQLAKQVSASAFRLGGSGWYETDFKAGNKKNLAGDAGKSDKSDSSASQGASANDASKSDSTTKTGSGAGTKPASQSAAPG